MNEGSYRIKYSIYHTFKTNTYFVIRSDGDAFKT